MVRHKQQESNLQGVEQIGLLFQILIFVLPRGRLLSTLSLPPLISGSVLQRFDFLKTDLLLAGASLLAGEEV